MSARILIWHVHGAWTTSFVQGEHTYLIPVDAERGPDGRGRARTYPWPANAIEVGIDDLRHETIDLVIFQRPHELELFERWTGRVPGRDVPAFYVEHNAPQGRINEMRHPMADRDDLTLVHVTHFNRLFWDAGTTRTAVVEHGVVDVGYRYTGELARAAVVVNEPRRRGRVVGTDLLPRFETALPVDLFGMDAAWHPGGHEDVPWTELHAALGRRRVYLHPVRWTSLGLSLLEAMHAGMPVVALATTEVVAAVPPEAGVVSNDLDVLCEALRALGNDVRRARRMGEAARAFARERYGLARFLESWERLFDRTEVPR